MPRYTYNGTTVTASERRSSDRDDKKYMRTVQWNGKEYTVHYGDPNLPMRRNNEEARQNFLSRHNCDAKTNPTKPGFWACLDWARPDEGKAMSDTKSTNVTIKAMTDDTVTVAGYGVVFGGVDLDGETFTKSTDFMLDLVPAKLVLYDHGLNGGIKDTVIGKIDSNQITEDEDGLWIEAELSRHAAYMEYIIQLAEDGKLGWSSGSVGHLTAREGKTIKRWPIVEFSLTPTPAEPRTLGIEVLKSLAEAAPALEKLSTEAESSVHIDESKSTDGETVTPEDARPASAPVPELPADSTIDEDNVKAQEDDIVSDEEKVVEETATKKESKAADQSAVLDAIAKLADSIKGISERVTKIEDQPEPSVDVQVPAGKAPAHIKSLGDNGTKALAHWYRTGDIGGVKHMVTGSNQITLKASNDTDMNVGTDADGGHAVPAGHYQGIISRLHEGALWRALGVMEIPGRGTTVSVPFDNEADGEFVSTAEATTFDRDAPALGNKDFTLVKYTKKIQLSYELLEDEDSRLLNFLENWVGTGLARTHNSALVTEALASGTAGLTLDGTGAITAAEVPELMYKLKGEYADGAAWILARATEGAIRGLTGNNFMFVPTPQGDNAGSQVSASGRELFGNPVYNSAYMPAIGGGNKSMLYGNFGRMGLYMSPDITFLRDPYSSANTGQVNLFYYTRLDYGVLIAEAIQYATHPTA